MQARWLEPSVCAALLVGGLLAGVGLRAEAPAMVSFERVRPGTLAPGFRTLSSVESESGRWQVERVEGRFALGQVELGRAGYRLAVLEAPRLENVRAGVKLRVGQGDRAAGLAWRVRDAANYYAARLDFEDGEVVLYKFVRGNRIRLERLSGLRLNEREWHELTVDHVGDRVRVWLNGIPVASERDGGLSSPGMIGLWLPGDSTAHFERLWYEELPPDRDKANLPENSKRTNDGERRR
jgi:hypothetical protein